MSSNSTATCAYTSPNEFLNFAVAHGVNITSTIQECGGICSLAWGFGNPDLSGIGVNISYILQTILVFIFGPVFVLVKEVEWARKLQYSFIVANAMFTIPIAIAAIMRAKQDPPIFELTFLQSLMTMQFLGFLALTVASLTGISTILDEAVHEGREIWRLVIVALFLALELAIYAAFMSRFELAQPLFKATEELFAACGTYEALDPIITKKIHVYISKDLLWILLVRSDFLLLVAILILGVIVFGVAIIIRVAGGLVCLGLNGGVLYYLVTMERRRNILHGLAGPQYQDNVWGFGQIVALFLWVPVFVPMQL